MTEIDVLGYVAAGLVLASFCMKRLAPLRTLAIGSNVAFILYGYFAGIAPVLLLHVILLPINALRLRQALAARGPDHSSLRNSEIGPPPHQSVDGIGSGASRPRLVFVRGREHHA